MLTKRGLLVGLALAAVLPGAAQGASVDAITVYDETGWFAPGETWLTPGNRVLTPQNSQIRVNSADERSLELLVDRGPLGPERTYEHFSFWLAAPIDDPVLRPGVYDNATRSARFAYGGPGIDMSGVGPACSATNQGRFEVKDYALRADGTLDRVWIVYEHFCPEGPGATFGEIRLGVDDSASPLTSAPAIVRWPSPLEMGASASSVPVTLTAERAVAIGTASVDGQTAADFVIDRDDCSGRLLATGDTCEVWVRFLPRAPGQRSATLRVPVTDGAAREVKLDGFAYGGSTRFLLGSDPGDPVGQGASWSYTPHGSTIFARSYTDQVAFDVFGPGGEGDTWRGAFGPAEGDVLQAGRTYQATPTRRGAWMDVSKDEAEGNPRRCSEPTGTFTVTDARLDADNDLRSFAVDFEQRCKGAPGALRGSFEFRRGDHTPLPFWMPSSFDPSPSVRYVIGPPLSPAAAAGTEQQAPQPSELPVETEEPAAGTCAAGAIFQRLSIRGTRDANRLSGTSAGDLLLAGNGDDRVLARGGDDCVDGGRGDDRVRGGSGRDVLLGGLGDDALWGDAGRDRLRGGAGNDVLVGGHGRDRLDCGPGRRDVARGVVAGERVVRCERVIRDAAADHGSPRP